MRLRNWLLSFVLAVSAASPALAKYAAPQLANVPIERVLTNLSDQAAAKPKDAKLQFRLARAYAMAYATKAKEVEVQQKDKDEIWYGFVPRNVPFLLQPTDDKQQQELAEKRLAQAIETYEGALKLSPEDLVGRLGYAWCLDQAKQANAAKAEYRRVIAEAWKKEGDLERAGIGFRSLVAEAAEYLKPLLDAEKDADELKDLEAKVAKVNAVRRPITPIAVPLVAGLSAEEMLDRQARVRFDADGSGSARQWTWIKPNSGWLVYDKHQTGRVDSALQLFGNVTFWMFWEHGYEPLATLDDNRDGTLRGSELAGLAIWHDANQNGRSEPGEVLPLADHGFVAVNCRHQVDTKHPDRIEFSAAGVTLEDGSTRPTFDLRLQQH